MTSIPSAPFKLPLLEGTPAQVYLTIAPSWVNGTWRLASVPLGGGTKAYPANWPAPQVSGWTDALSWSGGSAPASGGAASSISVSTSIVAGERRIIVSYNGGSLSSGSNAQNQPLYANFGMFASQNPIANLDGAGNLIGSEMDTMKDTTPIPFVVVPLAKIVTVGSVVQTPQTLPPSTAYRIQMFLNVAVATETLNFSVSGISPLPTVTPIMDSGYIIGCSIDGTSPAQAGNYNISLQCTSSSSYVDGEVLKGTSTLSRFGSTVPVVVSQGADTTAPVISKLYLGAGGGGIWTGTGAPTLCVAQDTGSGIARIDHTLTMSLAGQTKSTPYTIPVSPASTAQQATWIGDYFFGSSVRPHLSEISPIPGMVFVHDASGVGTLVSSVTVTDAAGNSSSRSLNATLYIPTLVAWTFPNLPAANMTMNVAWMAGSSIGGASRDWRGQTITITAGGKGITEMNNHMELALDGSVLTPTGTNTWTLPSTLADGAHTLSAQLSISGGVGPSGAVYPGSTHTYNFTQSAPSCDGGCGDCSNCNDSPCGYDYDCPGDVGCFDASCSSRG